MKNKFFLLIFEKLIYIVCCSICVFHPCVVAGYEYLFLLPIVFTFLQFADTKFKVLVKKYIGIKILYITMILRYLILPVCLSLSMKISGVGYNPNPTSVQKATILMIIELIVIYFIVIYFGNKKLLKKKLNQVFLINSINQKPRYLSYFVIMIAIFFIIIHPTLINNFSFASYDGKSEVISFFIGLDVRIIKIALMLIFCIIVEKCRLKYNKTKKILFYIIPLMVGVIQMLVIKGENRATLLIGIISVCVVLIAAFPEMRKKTFLIILVFGGISLIGLSIYRMTAITEWRPSGGEIDLSPSGIGRMLQAYMSGPRSIAQGIEAIEYIPVGIDTLISDILIWTGYLGNFISKTFNINYIGTSFLFNQYVYRNSLIGQGDQIIPLCIQSYWYFGAIGSTFFSALLAYTVVSFDKKICFSKSLDMVYINTIMAVVSGLMLGYNISIFFLYLFDTYLIYYIVIKFTDIAKVKLKIK